MSNPIFNYAVDKLYHRDCDSMVGLPSSMRELLVVYFEKEENVAHSIVCTSMDGWLVWIAVVLKLEEGYPDQSCLGKDGFGCPFKTVCLKLVMTILSNPGKAVRFSSLY